MLELDESLLEQLASELESDWQISGVSKGTMYWDFYKEVMRNYFAEVNRRTLEASEST